MYFAGSPAPGSNTSGTVQAIWVNTADPASLIALPYTDSSLLTRTLTGATNATGTAVRTVPDHRPVRYHCPAGVSSCPALHAGWQAVLPGCGEQLTGSPRVRAGRLQFTTTSTTAACTRGNHTGDNWMMSLDYMQGHDNGRTVFDINNDSTIDNRDSLRIAGVKRIPVGIHIGSGRISAPLQMRVNQQSDSLVINRLLPLAAVNPVPTANGGQPALGNQLPPPPGFGKPAPAGALPALLQPVVLPSPGPKITLGRRSWIDSVQ